MSAVPNDPFRSNEDAFLGPRAPRSIVLVGHLPVMSGLWLSQFASRETRRVPTVCMLRLEHDAVQVELFRVGPQRVGLRAQSTLPEALRAIAPLVDRWLIVPRSGEPVRLPLGTNDVVVLTGANEVACLAAYGLVKAAAEAEREPSPGRAPLPIAVEVLGATPDETETVRRHLARTAQTFLGLDLPISGELQRVAPVESAFRGTFDAHSPSLEDLFGMIRDAERAPAARPIASGRPRALPEPGPLSVGDRFAPRRDRLPPRTRAAQAEPVGDALSEVLDRAPIPFAPNAGVRAIASQPPETPAAPDASARNTPSSPSVDRAAEARPGQGIASPRASAIRVDAPAPSPIESGAGAVFDPRAALDRAAPARVAPRRTTEVGSDGLLPEDTIADLLSSLPGASSGAGLGRAPRSGPVREARAEVDPVDLADAAPPLPEVPVVSAAPESADRAGAPAASGGVVVVAPQVPSIAAPTASTAPLARPTPTPDATARAAFVAAPLPVPLAPHLGAFEVLPFRAPRGPAVELAIGADGTLHLVAPLADLSALLATRRWAVEHAPLLAAACPALRASCEPKLHAVAGSTVDALASEGVAAADIELHALALVEIGNARGWLAQPLPR